MLKVRCEYQSMNINIILLIMPHAYKSSFRFVTLTEIGKEDYRKAKHIISHIIENPESAEFREPVDWQTLRLLDYPTLIPHPMDLGTVLRKVTEEGYEFVEEFLDDTQLIWDNCKTYNLKGSWIYQLADKLQKNCKKMLKNYFPTVPLQNLKKQSLVNPINNIGVNQVKATPDAPKTKAKRPQKEQKSEKDIKLYYQDEQQISFSEKLKLADKFKMFSAHQNRLIVDYIKTVCITAFRDSEERVQILVDNMDIITFKQILEKIQEIQVDRISLSTKKQKNQ